MEYRVYLNLSQVVAGHRLHVLHFQLLCKVPEALVPILEKAFKPDVTGVQRL